MRAENERTRPAGAPSGIDGSDGGAAAVEGTSADAALTSDEARALTDRIKASVEELWHLVIDAYRRGAWLALGYESWATYCTSEFGAGRIRIPSEERGSVVALMTDAGMSRREISAATGLGYGTVARSTSDPNGSDDDLGCREILSAATGLGCGTVARSSDPDGSDDDLGLDAGEEMITPVASHPRVTNREKPEPEEREKPELKTYIDALLVRQVRALAVRMDIEEWPSSFAPLVAEARLRDDQTWFRELDAALETIYSVSSRMLEQVRKPDTEPTRVLSDQDERDSRFRNTHERRIRMMKMQNVAGRPNQCRGDR